MEVARREVAKKHQKQLARIKLNVKNSYEAFRPNYERYHEFRRFVFETSLSSDDIALLQGLEKPQIEFNISEAYISRLMGEFSKQEPAITVGADDDSRADPETIKVVENHIRHILRDSKNYHTRWEIMKDLYSGGFSVGKVWTDYAHSMSMNQVLNVDRVFDPTLCGWDQTARYSHKGDGRFCFELFPYELEEFKKENKHLDLSKISFNRAFAGFNWSYLNGNEKIILVCDYYEKKKRKVQIVETSDNRVMTVGEYQHLLDTWDDFAPPPVVKGEPRWTTLETICRYRCVENQVIEYTETDFTYFPLIFFDGNSIMLKNPKTSGAVQQYTRPYVYHAKGAQKLKNFAGITLANEMENIVQHKFIVAKEALPKEMDWLNAYKDMQKPSNMVFNAFFEQDPDKPIPNPIREIQRVPTPPEVVQTFSSTDSLIQNILGSYDASLGINDNQLSGVAIVEAATQSNSAAMPYIVGFLQGLNRIAEIIIDLIPKYYVTPRTIPVMNIEGKADYVKINQDGGVDVNYDTNVLNVKVEAGVSFQIQKSRALQQLMGLMGTSELFNRFMNEKGLPVLLDNIEIRGIDSLKLMVEEWMQQLEKEKQMAMQAQQQEQQQNPLIIKNQIEIQKLQQKAKEDQQEAQFKNRQFQVDMRKQNLEEQKIRSQIKMAHENNLTQRIKAETERYAKRLELAMKEKDMHHRHFREAIETKHKVNQPIRSTIQ